MNKKITNLEYYKDEINEIIENDSRNDVNSTIGNAFAIFSIKHIDNYPHRPDKFIDWLLEEHKEQEHKEPIKLKQWEYDMMYGLEDGRFYNWDYLCYMKRKGYFKGITDISMEIEDILKNYEIVSDDYEGFDECK